ncbi:MAG: chromate transporter [Treponema sp.]|uniref:chromate transporter n=1 Tax=uncultured Treponema sp. TaxID=162155 RepID=UPI0025E4E488|nr:chromate transporter [uncultured Treponema sp.]MBR4600821.1 chromate transporter [Treponema sp.]
MTDFIIAQIQAQSGVGLLCLVAVFFYVGLITIGGGQVGITVMQQVLVDQFHLLDDAFFFNMVAISESTPGPIGINIATYIGTELYGVWGGFFSTLGEVLPSLICIVLIAKFFGSFAEKKGVKAAFSTLRPAVSGVVAVAAVRIVILALFIVREGLLLSSPSTWNENLQIYGVSAIFYLLCLLLLFRTKIHPVFLVAAGALFGVIFC